MELQTQDIANVLLIRVEGRIDHTTAKHFQDLLLPQLNSCTGEAKKALLDLSGVHYMSSAGLRVLVLAARQCQQQQGEIVLAALDMTRPFCCAAVRLPVRSPLPADHRYAFWRIFLIPQTVYDCN